MDESVVKHLEAPQKVTKLSQAIREGSKLRPKCTGYMFQRGGSCALGAAYEAAFGYPHDAESLSNVMGGTWTMALHRRFNIPDSINLMTIVGQDMNDSRGMTREAIADVMEDLGY